MHLWPFDNIHFINLASAPIDSLLPCFPVCTRAATTATAAAFSNSYSIRPAVAVVF